MRHPLTLAHSMLVAALAVLLVQPLPAQTPALPSPAEFFGFPMGAEGELAGWDRMVDYVELIGERSDRVLVEELGRTTNDNPYLLLTISAPQTIADRRRWRRPSALAEAIWRTGRRRLPSDF